MIKGEGVHKRLCEKKPLEFSLEITQADAGTQMEEELVQLEEKQQEVVAKVFCLDEDRDESDSEADDSGWEDDDNNQDYFSD